MDCNEFIKIEYTLAMKFKILLIFLGWFILSGYSPYVATQVAGCALQAAGPVAKVVDAGIKKGLQEIDSIVKKNVSTEDTVELSKLNKIEEREPNLDHTSMNIDILKRTNACPYCNLRGADLRGANLSQADLRHANLKAANLTGTNFRYANLDGVLLKGAKLKGANFLGAKLNEEGVNYAQADRAVNIPDLKNITKKEANFRLKFCPGLYKPSWNNCIGTRTYSDKAVYKGPWKLGKQHGIGALTYPDGEKYVGGFKDGLHHGKGKIIYPSGKVMEGIWENDKFKSERK